MKRGRYGRDNNNWRGGRSVDPRGYVLIRVGKEHPLADVRGYAYEHRLVAQEALDRPLTKSDLVHHKDENTSNNNAGNLKIVDHAHHKLEHRHATSRRRLPGQANERITCECGCGESFDHFDAVGRPRCFVPGHNPHTAPVEEAIQALLAKGPMSRQDIAAALGLPLRALASALWRLQRDGMLRRVRRGVWGLAEGRHDGS